MEGICGKFIVGRSTKQLLRSAEAKRIAVIHHQDIDEMAASGLIAAKVRAVINASPTMTGNYPLHGPMLLLRAGIPILEIRENDFLWFEQHTDSEITVTDRFILVGGKRVPCISFTEERWRVLSRIAQLNVGSQLGSFIDNTLHYAKKEKNFVIHPLIIPVLSTRIAGRHVVVIARGNGYKNDLMAIRDYIEDYKPVLIGVDGGADALLAAGYIPDIIVGDMDSITDKAIACGAEVLVHAYPDGFAPGLQRVEQLNVAAKVIPAPGTSEDIAMLLAYEQGAELIVTLGAHTHMLDFLEKGRKGMASTMLVRMKIGAKLMDAKGVSKLYHRRMKWRYLWIVPVAGVFPLMMLGFIHPGVKHFFYVLWMYVKLSVHT